MEDEFAELYQKLIAWLEPDPARLRRGLQFLESLAACADPASSELPPLLFSQKCDIQGAETRARSGEHRKAGKDT